MLCVNLNSSKSYFQIPQIKGMAIPVTIFSSFRIFFFLSADEQALSIFFRYSLIYFVD